MKTYFGIIALAAMLIGGAACLAQEDPRYDPPDKLPTDPTALAAFAARAERSDVFRKVQVKCLLKSDFVGAAAAGELVLTTLRFPDDCVIEARIYSRLNRPDDVIRVLLPALHPARKHPMNVDQDPEARMLCVLARLDKHKWRDAVAIYEPTISTQQDWKTLAHAFGELPTVPALHYSSDRQDYDALTAQAHLISAVTMQPFFSIENRREWQLYHLGQALRFNPTSYMAHYLTGLLLIDLNRYSAARIEFQSALRAAPNAVKPQISAALNDLNTKQALQIDIDAIKSVQKPPH